MLSVFVCALPGSCAVNHLSNTPAAQAAPVARLAPAASANAPPDLLVAPEPTASPAPAGSADNDAGAPSTAAIPAPLVTLEASYAANERGALADLELARWNAGGTSLARPPGGASAYQPVPRVVVELSAQSRRPLRPASARLLDRLQAETRSNGYWPFRRCFEAGLRDSPALEGVTRVFVAVSVHGKVASARLLDSKVTNRDVVACLLKATQKLSFTTKPTRRFELVASIRLWPGDGPPPDAPAPSELTLDAPFDATRTTALIAGESAALTRCYEQARAQDPTLWGRLALSVVLERDGTVHRIEEIESHFPDASLARCAQAVVARLVFPSVLGKPFVFVQPIRFGAPPTE